MGDVPPKAFISHAGEDKPFVLQFAEKLRDNGINAWVDEWEILPGDKLIDKIFEQGIGQCVAFVIILSHNSVKKPWVVEELDAALVKRIEERTKIIPVRIDDCEVPVALRATAWINIDPEGDYDAGLHTVLSSIYGTTIKPPIGDTPEVFTEVLTLDDYDLEETRILEYIVKQQAETTSRHVRSSQIREAFPDLPAQVINDAIEVFEGNGIIEVIREGGMTPFTFLAVRVRPHGWVKYAPHFLGVDSKTDVNSVLTLIASEGRVSGSVISERLNMEPVRVSMAVDYLDAMGRVRCHRFAGSAPYTFSGVEATARGRRAVRS